MQTRAQGPAKAIQTPAALSVGEDWATPAIQQETTSQQLDPPNNSQIQAIEPSSFTQVLENDQLQPFGIEGAFTTHNADAWLAELANNDANDWLQDTVEIARSPPTSLATNTRTA